MQTVEVVVMHLETESWQDRARLGKWSGFGKGTGAGLSRYEEEEEKKQTTGG